MFAGNYAPEKWALCQGQLISITENEALFSLIGTTYGGDGRTTFALPDYRGRVVVHQGQNPITGTMYPLGQKAGTETVTLTTAQLPEHTHVVHASSQAGTEPTPENNVWGSGVQQYSTQAPNATMNPQTVSNVGGNQSHDNMMPYLTMNYIISLYGIYPQRS
ncbi:microcystin-dependent protein [Bacillus ectoiniformans]|uniref:phage tail protein n=1 Tax=Bacillus ectoiniformans TaxID=1494429 RepID=UPI00195BDD9E|nr:tail fiber protein [Bacillus ectoiniformans]MBM7647792.1 microcystin-dependent protein [Bacillus ectoiniformans]